MNRLIYQAGVQIIPLKEDENFTRDQPNFLVIDSYYGKRKNVNFTYPDGTSEVLNASCLNIRFVDRGFFDNGSIQEMVFPYHKEVEFIPFAFLPLLDSFQKLKENVPLVNGLLSLFKFENGNRLNGIVLKVDEERLDWIIDDEEKFDIAQILASFTYKEDVDEYLDGISMSEEDFGDYAEMFKNKPSKLPVPDLSEGENTEEEEE